MVHRQSEARLPQVVPGTLDLTDRARLGIRGLLGSLDPAADFDPYFLTFFNADPPYFLHWSSQYSGVLPKYLEALPLLRCMTGSREDDQIERELLRVVADNTVYDGLIYDEERPERPWNSGVGYGVRSWKEDYANLAGNGRLMVACAYYLSGTHDQVWCQRMERIAERLIALAILREDYAYYPNVGLGNDFSYPKHSGWVHTDEPAHGQLGAEGATAFYQSQPIRGLVRWYRISGDNRALDVGRRLANFVLKPQFWGGYSELEPQIGAARGHFWGHYHAITATLRALLEYAVAADDWRIKEFVRDAYEYARAHAVPQLGIFPGLNQTTEGCTIADMVALAIGLTDARVGDYWDDVDAYVRNGLVECQAVDRAEIERLIGVSPCRPANARWGAAMDWRFAQGVQRESLAGQESVDHVLDRALGGFSHLAGAQYQVPFLMSCCTANGNQAMYYAWEAIVRHTDNAAQVNLLLNRRSPFVDVESWLPWQGQVVLRNKAAQRLSVRIPAWVSREALVCELDGMAVDPMWIGPFVVFDTVLPGQVVQLHFPLLTDTRLLVQAGLNGRSWPAAEPLRCTFRGSTCIRIDESGEDPQGRQPDWYRVFREDRAERETVATRAADDYVAPSVIPW